METERATEREDEEELEALRVCARRCLGTCVLLSIPRLLLPSPHPSTRLLRYSKHSKLNHLSLLQESKPG